VDPDGRTDIDNINPVTTIMRLESLGGGGGQVDEFKNNYNIAIIYLSHSATASFFIQYVNANANILFVVCFADSYYDHANLTVHWNPRFGLITARGEVISSARVLIHEIIHAFLQTELGSAWYNQWLSTNDPEILAYFDMEYLEQHFVILLDDWICDNLGENSRRRNNSDLLFNGEWPVIVIVPDPTFHKPDYVEER
jgi:hypothetical protein